MLIYSTIMMLGKWQSNTYQRYINTTPEKLAQLSQTLATGGQECFNAKQILSIH